MDIRTLKTLLAIVDHGSFARAATAVGLSQSAVSLHVKLLEDWCQTDLFDRTIRPPRLSAAGSAFVDEAREVVRRFEALEANFRSEQGRRVGETLSIGAIPTVVTGVLPVALRQLRESDPTLRISLRTALSHELEQMVAKGKFDAVIVAEPAATAPGLVWIPFAQEPLVVIASAGISGRTDEELLTASSFVRFKRYAWASRLIDTELARRGIQVESTMEVDSLEGVVWLVANGLGVSVVPKSAAGNALPPGVTVIPFGDPPVQRVLGLIHTAANPRAELVQRLYHALTAVSGPAPILGAPSTAPPECL